MGVSAACSIQDGAAAAANVGATNTATPGNKLTVALQSSTGVTSWTLRVVQSDFPEAFPVGQAITQTSGFSAPFTLPNDQGLIKFSSLASDGNNAYSTPDFVVAVGGAVQSSVAVHRARGVVTGNVATLSAFVGVSGGTPQDGVTYAQGDVVLLVGQSTASQNGLYVVGVVASGTAPLTRAPDWATGVVLPAGSTVEISEGTQWNNSTWKVTTTGAFTVDATSVALYPRFQFGRTTLSSGAGTVSTCWALAASGANGSKVFCTDTTAAAAVKATLTAGAGSGVLTLAGTSSDVIDWCICNW